MLVAGIAVPALSDSGSIAVSPGSYPAISAVDPRFQSYNVEMAEVIGGRFWAPYPEVGSPSPPIDPANPTANMFRQREPLDLADNRRLRNFAHALGPAYMRVSGTWANAVYFQDDDLPRLAVAPNGFNGVLTRAQWAGVLNFAKAVDAKIVTSFSVSPGVRDSSGVWTPEQGRKLLRYTRSRGDAIYAAELVNEPNLAGGMPVRYGGPLFAKDSAAFRAFVANEASGLKIVGPGSAGETGAPLMANAPTEQLLASEPKPNFDVFSYHFYGDRSARCAALMKGTPRSPDEALGEAWLARTDAAVAFYKPLRDRFVPNAPIWITETAQASCGGDRWASTFLDTFRYVDTLGRLAKQGVSAVFHNTLAASDYALIDDQTLTPRPNYWAAVLWSRLMGATVLDGGALQPGFHLYAHCLKDRGGGVAMVAINLDRNRSRQLELPALAQRYTLTAATLDSGDAQLNGKVLKLSSNDRLPALNPVAARGSVSLPPASITFFALPTVANRACR